MKVYRNGPETARLMMRAMTPADAEAFLALNGDPVVMHWTHEPLMISLEEARDALESYPDFDTVGYGRWGCILKESKQLIGFCGLKYLSDLNEIDVGYRFLPKYWGRGLATEACGACVNFGFDVMQIDRIIGLVLPQNEASIRVLEKSGLVLEDEMIFDGLRALRYGIHRDSTLLP